MDGLAIGDVHFVKKLWPIQKAKQIWKRILGHIQEKNHFSANYAIINVVKVLISSVICNEIIQLFLRWNKQHVGNILGWFIWSAKVSNTYFSVAILTYAMLTLVLKMLTLVYYSKQLHSYANFSALNKLTFCLWLFYRTIQ